MVETQNSLDNIEDTHMHVVHAALHKSGDYCKSTYYASWAENRVS